MAYCKPYMSGYNCIPYLTFNNQGFVAQLATAQKINGPTKMDVLNTVLRYPNF